MIGRGLASGLLLLLAGCATARGRPVSAPGELAYRISGPSTPRAIDVEILRVRGGPAAFTFATPGAVERVRAQLEDGAFVELSVPASGELDVPNDWVALRYRFSLDDVHRWFGSTDLSWGVASQDELLLPGAAWLLRPRVPLPDLTATISTAGLAALLPWEPQSEGRWAVSSQQLAEPGFHAFGGRRCYLTVGQGRLEVAVLGAEHPLGDAALCEWIRSSAAEVLQVRAEFPVTRAAISIVPVQSNEASPFGRLLPSHPRSLGFLVGSQAVSEDFAKDVVALHELLHLAHPSFEPKETWLTEGLATYFTEVARTRSGRQSPENGWEELLDGFDRGAEVSGGMRMDEVIREQGVAGRLRAAAWTGVWFLLALDLELRRLTQGLRALDDVLDALGNRPISLAQFAAQVDALAGQPVFEAVFARQRGRPAFALRQDLLDALGVHRSDGKVRFEEAPRAAEREALMRIKVRPNR